MKNTFIKITKTKINKKINKKLKAINSKGISL